MTTLTKGAQFLLIAAAIAAPTAASLTAQIHDPAPVRIAVETYGSRSGGSGNTLAVELAAAATDNDGQVVVTGGPADGFAFLLVGSRRAALLGPFETVLLVYPDAVVPVGQLDASGAARLPIELVRKGLVGGTPVLLQALGIGGRNAAVWMSAGLSVRFAAGNAQPPLAFAGPPSTAILIARASGPSRTHEILHRVVVPTTQWRLTESARDSSGGLTRIYMMLEAPGWTEVVVPVVETKRSVIQLGSQAAPVIEVWIQQTQRGATGPAVFQLAARLERDF